MDTDIIKPTQPTPTPTPEPTPIPTEPKTPAQPNEPILQPKEPKKEKKSSRTLTLIFMALALCGLGFGIYGVFFQQSQTNCETAKVEEKTEEKADRGTSDSYHFYFGELNLKLEVPEEYKGKLSYLYRNDGTVFIWGYNSDERPEFANPLSEKSAPLFLINTSIDELTDGKDSYTEGNKIFTTESGKEYYLHSNYFNNAENQTELRNLASTLKLFFVDTYKYSNF